MTPLLPKELRRFADVLRLPGGTAMTVRFIEPGDVEALRAYFAGLSTGTHYSRFLGAARALPASELDRILRIGGGHHFAVVAEIDVAGGKRIIGEARYVLDMTANAIEFAISVADDWHGSGAASVLLSNLECRAAALGAETIRGDSLATNRAMQGLARKRGYQFSRTPGDWTLVRFAKDIRIAEDIPCVQSTRSVPLFSAAG